MIVASTDRIAADATGVAVLKSIGTEPRLQNRSIWSNPFLKHGIKIGLEVGRARNSWCSKIRESPSGRSIGSACTCLSPAEKHKRPHGTRVSMLDRKPLPDRERGGHAAGEVLQQWAHKFTVREKSPANLVTEADCAAQATIVELIRSRFPEHGILAEEGLDEPSPGQPFRWIIDPLDGLELRPPLPVLCGLDRPRVRGANRSGRDLRLQP